jgi:fermentation-respiration switch protein FrsA (DUF1100 family)
MSLLRLNKNAVIFICSETPIQSRIRILEGSAMHNIASDGNQKLNRNRLKTTVRALTYAGGGATALVTTISAYIGYRAVRPRRKTSDSLNPGLLLPPEKVSFKSIDGLKLNGYFYPGFGQGATIIICHGFHGASIDVHEPALSIQASGFNALTFDFSGCGASEGHTTSVGYYEIRDLLGAIEYVKTRREVHPDLLGVYGFSMGGATAILTAAVSLDVKVLVTDSAFASLDNVLNRNFKYFYRLPRFPFKPPVVLASRVFSGTVLKRVYPVEALRKLKSEGKELPLLIIHGDNDLAVPPTEANLLYEAHGGPKELWLVPGAGHVVARYADRQLYVERIVSFFRQHLRKARLSENIA